MDSIHQRPVEYLGEPSARSPVIAFLLTLLCPGFGAIYLGRTMSGILVCMLYISAAGLFVVVWTTLKFFPLWPGLVLLAGGLLVSLLLAFDAAVEAKRVGEDYILQGANHFLVYLLVALFFYGLPLAMLVQFTTDRLWTLIQVEGEAMFPTFVEGDLLLVDRTAFNRRLPEVGEVVVVRPARESGPFQLARIIGLPGEQVAVYGTQPFIEGEPVPRQPYDLQERLEGEESPFAGVAWPSEVYTWAEQRGGDWYYTVDQPYDQNAIFQAIRLEAQEYYLLHDNRSVLQDSRERGPYLRPQIIGRPTHVAFSRGAEGEVRWSRIGRRIP